MGMVVVVVDGGHCGTERMWWWLFRFGIEVIWIRVFLTICLVWACLALWFVMDLSFEMALDHSFGVAKVASAVNCGFCSSSSTNTTNTNASNVWWTQTAKIDMCELEASVQSVCNSNLIRSAVIFYLICFVVVDWIRHGAAFEMRDLKSE